MPVIVPIHTFHHGHHRPATEAEVSTMLGALLVVTAIWLVWSAIRIATRKNKDDEFWDWFLMDGGAVFFFMSVTVFSVYGVGALLFLGSLVGKLF